MKKLLPILLFPLLSGPVFSQTRLRIQENVRLQPDSVTFTQLVTSLDYFLSNLHQPAELTKNLDAKVQLATKALLDELSDVSVSLKYKDSSFFMPYLTSVVRADSISWLVGISYLGVTNKTPILRAQVELLASKKNGRIVLQSPISYYTARWQHYKTGNLEIYSNHPIPKTDAEVFKKNIASYDQRLKVTLPPTTFYLANGLPDALKILGLPYHTQYATSYRGAFSAFNDKAILNIDGLPDYFHNGYAHDLWHDRRSYVVKEKEVYRAMDEGCAYLYAGTWGISWKEVVKAFKDDLARHPGYNLLELFDKKYKFGDIKNSPLNATFVMHALIVKSIEQKKGFESVATLLRTGNVDNYFKALEPIAGINRTNFNEQLGKLLEQE